MSGRYSNPRPKAVNGVEPGRARRDNRGPPRAVRQTHGPEHYVKVPGVIEATPGAGDPEGRTLRPRRKEPGVIKRLKAKRKSSLNDKVKESCATAVLEAQGTLDALVDKEEECADLRRHIEQLELGKGDPLSVELSCHAGGLSGSNTSLPSPQRPDGAQPSGIVSPNPDPMVGKSRSDKPDSLRTLHWADGQKSQLEGPAAIELLLYFGRLISLVCKSFLLLCAMFFPSLLFSYILKSLFSFFLKNHPFFTEPDYTTDPLANPRGFVRNGRAFKNTITNDLVVVAFLALLVFSFFFSLPYFHLLFWTFGLVLEINLSFFRTLFFFLRFDAYSAVITLSLFLTVFIALCVFCYTNFCWLSKRGSTHTIEYSGLVDLNDLLDRRSDTGKMVDLKHADPMDTYVEYRRHWFGFCYYKRQMKISLTLLAQLAIPKNLELCSDDDVVFKRLSFAASKSGAVNNNRWQPLEGDFVIQDTQFMAYAMYKSMMWERSHLPFPNQ
jgi:hypothetical protein